MGALNTLLSGLLEGGYASDFFGLLAVKLNIFLEEFLVVAARRALVSNRISSLVSDVVSGRRSSEKTRVFLCALASAQCRVVSKPLLLLGLSSC